MTKERCRQKVRTRHFVCRMEWRAGLWTKMLGIIDFTIALAKLTWSGKRLQDKLAGHTGDGIPPAGRAAVTGSQPWISTRIKTVDYGTQRRAAWQIDIMQYYDFHCKSIHGASQRGRRKSTMRLVWNRESPRSSPSDLPACRSLTSVPQQ